MGLQNLIGSVIKPEFSFGYFNYFALWNVIGIETKCASNNFICPV